MKKRILSILLILCMLMAPAVVMAEENASTNEDIIASYSGDMQKYIIKLYAKTLASNYYYGVEDEELLYSVICNVIEEGKLDLNSAIRAMVETLGDEYAEFYTPEEYKSFTEDISGEFSGIGVTINENKDGVVILSVFENGPAYKAGMMPYDYIVGVDGADVRGKSSEEIRELIVGEKGTEVKVTVLRAGKEIELTCIRDTVEVSQIETKMITDKIAYIKLIQFTSNAPDEMRAVVENLREKNVKNVIFDLRDNPGGDLNAAIEMANIFISAGDIIEIRYKDEKHNTMIKSDNYNAPKFKMLVLMNEYSASASEFLATAIQSRGAGKVLGVQSYGKGSLQSVSNAVGGAGFKYTVGEFYSFKGQRVHTIGVTPDFVVENEYIEVDMSQLEPIDIDVALENLRDENNVLALEQRLKLFGYLPEADGIYDEETKDAVARFQAMLGYSVTGEVSIYEYIFLNDYNYDDIVIPVDKQMEAAIKYFS
ncbi:MAG: S41 family peptidase [Clostridia bacterium]|nr:S41 family peptidase [Clostridia bacterium]